VHESSFQYVVLPGFNLDSAYEGANDLLVAKVMAIMVCCRYHETVEAQSRPTVLSAVMHGLWLVTMELHQRQIYPIDWLD
jgi:hypothetical protein